MTSEPKVISDGVTSKEVATDDRGRSVDTTAFAELSEAFSAGRMLDPYPVFAERRRHSPVMHGDILAEFGVPSKAAAGDPNRPIFSVFRYDDIVQILQDTEVFSSSIMLEGYGKVLGRMITGLDGDEHRIVRSLMQPAFSRGSLDQWKRTVVEPVIRDFVVGLAAKRRADMLADFAQRFPARVIYHILGFPDEPASIERFNDWAVRILLVVAPTTERSPDWVQQKFDDAFAAGQELYDHVIETVRQRRATGASGDDLISRLIRAEYEGHMLSDEEITVFVRSLLPAAADTTTRSFANFMACLLQRPDDLAAVRADRSLLPSAINEALRFESTVTYGTRRATRDVTLRNVSIPAGAGVNVIIASGNRDGEAFPEPDTFDIRRMGKPNLSFHLGPHLCIGMHLAKLEIEVAANALLDLPGLRRDPDLPAPEILGAHFRCPSRLPVVWD